MYRWLVGNLRLWTVQGTMSSLGESIQVETVKFLSLDIFVPISSSSDTVNYKLTSEKFIKLKETFGFIENTSDALIEFAITTGKPVFNDKGNQLVIPNGKLSYELEEGQGIYARPVDRLSGEINVSEVRINNSDVDGDYYTKVEVDNNFVKKDGNAGTATKLQTPRNITLTGDATGTISFDGSADVEIAVTVSGGGSEGEVPSILSTQGNPFSLHYCTKSEYDSLDKIQDDSTIYLVLDESTGEIVIKVYRP